jgi:hypothetical protein
MTFDRFAICEAFYMFAMLNHGGQASTEYEVFARLDRLRYRPRPMLSDPDDLDIVAREIFERLESGDSSIRPR